MSMPKEVHLQFDSNGHVTHVHMGAGAPEKFGRYVLVPPLTSPEAADFVRLLRDAEPVCPACGVHHGVGVDGLPDDTCGDPPREVEVGTPLFADGNGGVSTAPRDATDRPIGVMGGRRYR